MIDLLILKLTLTNLIIYIKTIIGAQTLTITGFATYLILLLVSILIVLAGLTIFIIHGVLGCIGISLKVLAETILYPLGYLPNILAT